MVGEWVLLEETPPLRDMPLLLNLCRHSAHTVQGTVPSKLEQDMGCFQPTEAISTGIKLALLETVHQ